MEQGFDFIEIDGVQYNVRVKIGVKRAADFLYKYAKRVQSGSLESEMIGVYYNYSNINFEKQNDKNYDDYNNLYNVLTMPTEYHTIKIGGFQFMAYCNSITDEIYLWKNGKPYFKNLTVTFTSKNPARR